MNQKAFGYIPQIISLDVERFDDRLDLIGRGSFPWKIT
jgi:hypothetical protein